MSIYSVEDTEKHNKERQFERSYLALRQLSEIFSVKFIAETLGTPQGTLKNYFLGIQAMPTEMMSKLYSALPASRPILYPILCPPNGFEISQKKKNKDDFDIDEVQEILSQVYIVLGKITEKVTKAKKSILKRPILSSIFKDVEYAKEIIDLLHSSASEKLRILLRKGPR